MNGATEPKPRSLARWIEPPIPPHSSSEAQLARQWSAIRERREQRRASPFRFGWWAGGGLGGLLLVAALLMVLRPESDEEGWESGAVVSSAAGAVIESGAEPIAVHLADGSQIDLDARTRLEAAEAPGRDVRFELRRGRATFEVARDPGRTFAVAAGAVRVVVVGTRFSVEHATSSRIAVTVERGVVEVHTARGVRRLGAGETWSGDAAEAADDGETADIGTVGAAPAEQDEEPTRVRRDVPSASELFEQARAARREARDADAAEAYEQLLRRHPRDGHAGLAAFELARIRMDVLHDSRGAIDPLERAIAARVFREDAMARLVRAYDETEQSARCRAARDRYLDAYPSGVHRTALEPACTD